MEMDLLIETIAMLYLLRYHQQPKPSLQFIVTGLPINLLYDGTYPLLSTWSPSQAGGRNSMN